MPFRNSNVCFMAPVAGRIKGTILTGCFVRPKSLASFTVDRKELPLEFSTESAQVTRRMGHVSGIRSELCWPYKCSKSRLVKEVVDNSETLKPGKLTSF